MRASAWRGAGPHDRHHRLRAADPVVVPTFGGRFQQTQILRFPNARIGEVRLVVMREVTRHTAATTAAAQQPLSATAFGVVHQEGRRFSVPKATLVSKLIQLVHSGTLAVHGDLKDWPVLKREMEIFRPEITPSGRETWHAAGSGHDDLLTAAALCAWYAQHDDMNSWGNYALVRRRAAVLGNDTMPEEFVVGVDIGQSNDPTAIAVMSRIDGPNPRTDRHFEPVAQPESTVDGSDYVGSEAWLADLDEQQKRAVATGSTMTGPLALTPPRPLPYVPEPPQPGSAESRLGAIRDHHVRGVDKI